MRAPFAVNGGTGYGLRRGETRGSVGDVGMWGAERAVAAAAT